MLSGRAHDFPGSKINALVDKVAAVWQRSESTRGTQMIFCDMGIHPTAWGYSAYEEIIHKLTARGIPRSQIAAAGDADTDAKKRALFDKVRSGQVRVLLGSTQKMGTGTNVQKRLVALHHLDAPWKPAEVEQREGRILRQGNENEEVAVYRYVTEGSFDAFMWQALETKARFISQVMTGDNAARRAEDIGGQELSYAEVKAIASGNPAVLTLAEADAELQRLSVLKRNHADEQYLARRNLRELPDTIDRLSQRLSHLTTDMTTANAHADDGIAVGTLGGQLDTLPEYVREERRVPLGVYRGLRFGMVLHPQYAPEIYLEGATTGQHMLSREHRGPRAVLNALERLAGGYGAECDRVRQELAIAEGQRRDYQARLGTPFPHDGYLSRLISLRDQLKAGLASPQPAREGGLSGAAPAAADEPPPTVAELAEQIKALKSAHTIEATPERVAKRRSSAEEPVTARIRRRSEELPALAPATEPGGDASGQGTSTPPDPLRQPDSAARAADPAPPATPADQPGTSRNVSSEPDKTYQDRLAMGRRKQYQASLF